MSIQISEDSPIYDAVKEITKAQREAEVGWSLNVPMWVYQSTEISSSAKLLYGRIMSFTGRRNGKPKYCYASNAFFANEFGVSDRAIRTMIEELISSEMIERVVERTESGTQRFLVPTIACRGGGEKLPQVAEENFHQVSRVLVESSSSLSSSHSSDDNSELLSSFSPATQPKQDFPQSPTLPTESLFPDLPDAKASNCPPGCAAPPKPSIATDKIAAKSYTLGTKIMAAWNAVDAFPKARSVDVKRQRAIRKMLNEVEDFEETWQQALAKASTNAFLCGANSRGWTLDFDTFLTPRIFNRIVEGAYDRGSSAEEGQSSQDEWLAGLTSKNQDKDVAGEFDKYVRWATSKGSTPDRGGFESWLKKASPKINQKKQRYGY